jgi:hypothetical protein
MASEHVFYGQTTTGVGGDIGMVTAAACRMVGFAAMGPTRIDLSDRIADERERTRAERKVVERFQGLGDQLVQRASNDGNPYAGVLGDGAKRKLVTGLLGQAFVIAHMTIRANKDKVDYVASRLVAAGEMYGNEVTDLLDEVGLVKPEIDVLDEATWPAI